ncbi:MAG: tripartite tricarboxylate transporter TctB family protein [Opitutaceae bacterium]
MRLNDTLTGILLFVVGVAVAGYAQTFPPSPGQQIGPGLFPSVIGCGLALCGVVLLVSAVRQSRAMAALRLRETANVSEGRDGAWLEFDEWVRRPRMVLNGALVIADLIFYALVVDRVGFFVTALVFLTVLLLAFGVRRRWIPVLAVAVTLGLHLVFYTLLRVPLPWGWFERIAW